LGAETVVDFVVSAPKFAVFLMFSIQLGAGNAWLLYFSAPKFV